MPTKTKREYINWRKVNKDSNTNSAFGAVLFVISTIGLSLLLMDVVYTRIFPLFIIMFATIFSSGLLLGAATEHEEIVKAYKRWLKWR